MTPSHHLALRLIVTILLLLGAGSSANLAALETINVSYPSPAPFYIPMAVALHQGFFRDQGLDVQLIVTRAGVDRAALIGGDIDFALRNGSTILSAPCGPSVRTVFLPTLTLLLVSRAPRDQLGRRDQKQNH